MLKDLETKLEAMENEIADLEKKGDDSINAVRIDQIKRNMDELLNMCENLSASDKVYLSRHPKRPNIDEIIEALFEDFFEIKGDHLCKEDASILGGIAFFHGTPVTVIGHKKGRSLEENMLCNFGMTSPEGYRKSLRLMKQAEKFGRPIITFINTPGAYPGIEAEAHGQSEAIARNIAEMSTLKVPVIAVITGEGSSGGALALGVADSVLMLEHAVYSILSPEGFAAILWKDSSRSNEACDIMKITAQDLLEFGIIDGIISEPLGGAQRNPQAVFDEIDKALVNALAQFKGMNGTELAAHKYDKFRTIGEAYYSNAADR